MLSRCITTSLLALSSSSSTSSAILIPTRWCSHNRSWFSSRERRSIRKNIVPERATVRFRHYRMPTFSTTADNDSDALLFTNPDDDTIRTILTQTRTVAMIGASNRPERDSYHVMEYLIHECGYQVIPINPMYTDQTILNQKVYRTLSEVLIQFPNVDMIDIFRRSSEVPEIIQELIQFQQQQPAKLEEKVDDKTAPVLVSYPKYIWMQINVIDPKSAQLAQQHGYQVVMNQCPLREIPRLQIPLPIHVPIQMQSDGPNH